MPSIKNDSQVFLNKTMLRTTNSIKFDSSDFMKNY